MRVNANLFWILAAFFGAAGVLYTVWSYIDSTTNPHPTSTGVEWVGTVGIALATILSIFIAFYLTITRRAQGGELPEDRPDAAIDDGDPEVGHFSPWSWWPMFLALGLALMFLGFAAGTWITFIGAPVVLLSVIGWVYEYYRSNFAR